MRFPNVYGIDMPTRSELIAYGRTDDEIAKVIGADALVYQDIGAVQQAVTDMNPALTRFDLSCFDGQYVTGDVTPEYLDHIERSRGARKDKDSEGGLRINMGHAATEEA